MGHRLNAIQLVYLSDFPSASRAHLLPLTQQIQNCISVALQLFLLWLLGLEIPIGADDFNGG